MPSETQPLSSTSSAMGKQVRTCSRAPATSPPTAGSDPDLRRQERPRPDPLPRRRQPRRRVRGPDHARPPDPRVRSRRDPGPADHPAGRQPAGRARRPALLPIDDGNLNRSFPGDPDGPPTAAIAHFIESVLLPRSLDLHLRRQDARLPAERARPAARGRPLGRGQARGVAVRRPDRLPRERCARTAPHRGRRPGHIVALGTELGGAGTVSLETLTIARAGVRNTLAHSA